MADDLNTDELTFNPKPPRKAPAKPAKATRSEPTDAAKPTEPAAAPAIQPAPVAARPEPVHAPEPPKVSSTGETRPDASPAPADEALGEFAEKAPGDEVVNTRY
jgi:hypothetical protein